LNLTQKDYKLLSSAFDIAKFIQNNTSESIKEYVDFRKLSQQARVELLLNSTVTSIFFNGMETKILKFLDNTHLVDLYRSLYRSDSLDIVSHLMPSVIREINTRVFPYTLVCRLFLIKHREWANFPSLKMLTFKAADIRFISSTVGITRLYEDLVRLCNTDIDAGRAAVNQFIERITETVFNESKNRMSSEFRSYVIVMRSFFIDTHIDLPLVQLLSKLYTPKTTISLIAKAYTHRNDYPGGAAIFGHPISLMSKHGLVPAKTKLTVCQTAIDWAVKTHTASVLTGTANPIDGRLSKNLEIIKQNSV